MLNKPKFMSPSTNLQECVVDANANEIPFSCIVDGNEAIAAWQIQIYTLNDGGVVLNTGKRPLLTPFSPIDNKNRNIVFSKDIKPYILSGDDIIYYPATSTYDADKTYYTRSGSEGSYTYSKYTYSPSTWNTKYTSLFYVGEFKNITSPYYWTISFWSVADKENELPTTTSCEEVFYTNSVVVPTIQYGVEKVDESKNKYIYYSDLTEGSKLSSSKFYFKATYEQAESVGLKRYGWRIKDVDNDRIIIDTITHNQIYGTEDNITCFYDGFLNSENYSIEVYIETQNNAVVVSEPINFSVLYEITYLTNDFKVSALNKEAAIMLDWAEAKIIGGRKIGEDGKNEDAQYKTQYPIIDYSAKTPNTSIVIEDNSQVIFDYNANSNLDIPESCYIVISTQLLDNNERVLFSAEGVDGNKYELIRNLTFNGSYFIYTIVDSTGIPKTIKTEEIYTPNKYKWYIITMSPFLGENGNDTWFRVVESAAINGLYPSEDLYPSETLYPTFGVWDKLKDGDE